MDKRVALVTGGATGIGKAVVKAFSQKGYAVVINYNRSESDALALQSEISQYGGDCVIFKADVSTEQGANDIVQCCRDHFGRLDVLVNNAGVTRFIPFSDLDSVTEEVWESLLNVNVKGSFYCSRAAAKLMQEDGGGSIVNIASQAGMRAMGSSIAYAVSKAGVIHMTKCLAIALAPHIRVNSVSPGIITGTEWHRGKAVFDREAHNLKQSKLTPLGRVGTPEDVAETVLFLASDEASFITGVNVAIDGGRTEFQT